MCFCAIHFIELFHVRNRRQSNLRSVLVNVLRHVLVAYQSDCYVHFCSSQFFHLVLPDVYLSFASSELESDLIAAGLTVSKRE